MWRRTWIALARAGCLSPQVSCPCRSGELLEDLVTTVRRRRILGLATALVGALALASCGSSGGSGSSGSGSGSKTFELAVFGDYTGPSSGLGKTYLDIVKMATD